MIDMILNYVLLNIPEGIVVTILAFSGLKFKENRKKYLSAILSSSLLIYIVPELFGSNIFYVLLLIIFLFLLFYFGYEIKFVLSLKAPFLLGFITGISQIPLLIILKNTIGLSCYFNLSVVQKFITIFPYRLLEVLLLYIIMKRGVKMKKFWLLGKVNDRKRGERA